MFWNEIAIIHIGGNLIVVCLFLIILFFQRIINIFKIGDHKAVSSTKGMNSTNLYVTTLVFTNPPTKRGEGAFVTAVDLFRLMMIMIIFNDYLHHL